jgi:biopolymer transport protein ExbD
MAFIAFDGSFSITFTPLVQDLMMIWLVVFTLMPLALIVIERVEIDLPSRLEE